MNDSPYTIRNYRNADFDSFVRLYREAVKDEPPGRTSTREAVADSMKFPGYSPEEDLFIVEACGDMVGYLDVRPELAIERVIISCWVLPGHRRKGLAAKLLESGMKRTGDLGAPVAHVNILEENVSGKMFLERLGFLCIRRYLELRLDMSRLDIEQVLLASGGCRHLKKGEEAALTTVQNRSFSEHWGYNPNTVEMTTAFIERRNCSHEDVVLTCEVDKIIGYCWTQLCDDDTGIIYMIGTDPDYRGRGIGRKLLMAGLAHMHNKNVHAVTLTVDSENTTALALYESTGFEVWKRSLWYEKAVA